MFFNKLQQNVRLLLIMKASKKIKKKNILHIIKHALFTNIHIVTCLVIDTGFGLVTGFSEFLPIVTTSNYCPLAKLHALKFTIAHTILVFSQFVFTSGCLVANPNNIFFCSRLYRWLSRIQPISPNECAHSRATQHIRCDAEGRVVRSRNIRHL
jgi:hypothetical protein